ncbi:MAG: hybrid sensor histidine kinase/response regulator [Gemmatimonadota bacterium]|jgi:CheY-like chemotaxis protein|nr:hybrid sensor histidine kinase/response regulator [Gemmatimonadota bacterium]
MRQSPDFASLGAAAAEMMHDMLSLLTLVEGRMALVLEELRAGRSAEAEVETTLAECRDLKAMIADVMSTARSPAVQGSFRPVELVHSEIERAVRGAPAVEVRFRADAPADLEVPGRASFLRRIAGNLLRNALRHARSRIVTTVAPETRAGRAGVLLSVEDDGGGVPAELRDSLFRPGVHGGHGGSGLGLASVSWAARQLGGTVAVGDGGELGGARFEVWLPTVRARTALPAVVTDAGLAGCCVVLIDDDASIRRVFARLFGRAGARVVALAPEDADGEAWWAEIEQAEPDVILLDLELGGWDGVAVWESLCRRAPALAERAVFVSGAEGGERGDAAARRTGRPVLSKALDVMELVARVAAIAAARHGASSGQRSQG